MIDRFVRIEIPRDPETVPRRIAETAIGLPVHLPGGERVGRVADAWDAIAPGGEHQIALHLALRPSIPPCSASISVGNDSTTRDVVVLPHLRVVP